MVKILREDSGDDDKDGSDANNKYYDKEILNVPFQCGHRFRVICVY